MVEITDDFMREMLAKTKTYTLVLLKKSEGRTASGADAVIWEHGRRNFVLRAEGRLAIVCPVVDDREWSGIGIFDGTPEEVAQLMDDDPGVKAGVFTYEVHPVRSFPGDCLPG